MNTGSEKYHQTEKPTDVRMYEDCYYFLYSTCKKSSECVYRHNPAAKENKTLCPEWANSKKCRVDCPMRHSLYHLNKKRQDDLCYFEITEQGCTKQNCDFKHRNPVKDAWKEEKLNYIPQNVNSSFEQEYDIVDNIDHARPWLHENVHDSLQFKKQEPLKINSENEAQDEQPSSSQRVQDQNSVCDEAAFYRNIEAENSKLQFDIRKVEAEIKDLNQRIEIHKSQR
ncbi:hypothetical protein GINT2_001591 [Glugoides intestinalis]